MIRSTHLSALALLAGALAIRADFTPVSLTPDSFTQDIVVEKGAIHAPVLTSTTASMDNGTNNTGFTWYEIGYNLDSPSSGLPAAGSTAVSQIAADHSYTFAASFHSNNAVLVDTNLTTATLTLTTPTALSGLSFLTAAGHGPVTVKITVHYANGTTETNTFASPDWFGSDAAITANGRIDAGNFGFANVDSFNPNLYSADVALANSGSPVTSIDFDGTEAGGGHAAIFAVSGATSAGGEFVPLAVQGFNQDLVVEQDAPRVLTSLNATTASVDAGIANTGASFYEMGYATNSTVTNAALTGLPAAGSTITNSSAVDHRYVLPSSYTGNNALLIDTESFGTIRFATPTAFSALSFLTGSGNGPVRVAYIVSHVDGSTDTGVFVSPDWFNNPNPAITLSGRVNVQNGGLDSVGSNNPRLYSADIALANTTSPVTTIDLSFDSENTGTGHAVIFAVSGASGTGAPTIVGQPGSVNVLQGSSAQIVATASGTLPLNYTWQVENNGTFVNLTNSGNISGADTATLNINNAEFANQTRYRVVVSNNSGTNTSAAATLTVLSSTPSFTAAGDAITIEGGSTPAAEPVEMAIDGTTSKYLNFGTDGDQNAPFAGPVGFTVIPTLGSDVAGTVITALRVYTANDAPERDPAGYRIEGSNDGTVFTPITSGTLALPDQRNAAGLALDPLTQGVQEVRFANSMAYKVYRVLFTSTKDSTAANSVQLGEVELLGTVATSAPAQLTVNRNTDGTLTLTSSQPGTLQSTSALVGDGSGTVWANEGPINGPVTVNTTEKAKFYRILVQQ